MDRTDDSTNRLPLLFTPGERLGWVFRDRWQLVRPFTEPQPVPAPVPQHLIDRAERHRTRRSFRMKLALGLGFGVSQVLLCVAAATAEDSNDDVPIVFLVLALVAFAGTIAAVIAVETMPKRAARAVQRAYEDAVRQHAQATGDWLRRRDAFNAEEHRGADSRFEWGAARTADGTRPITVVGGTPRGWEAFLTVFGSSMLGTRGMLTVVDLSAESVCADLVRLCTDVGTSVDVQRLPPDLADSDLLVGLDPRNIVDTLIGSMYGNRTDDHRATDERILTEICDFLQEEPTIRRIAAALRVLMDSPGEEPDLTGGERRRVAGHLFSAEYRRQVHDRMRRMEAHLRPLRELGTRREPRDPAYLTCLTLDSDGSDVRSDPLVDLIMQWTIRRVTAPHAPRTLVLVGADDLPRRHLDQLTAACQQRDIRLVTLYRHLRQPAQQLLDSGGTAGFMRLDQPEEADRAATFIGRRHTFALTRLIGHGGTDGRPHGWSTTRDWSAARAWAEGTNWTDAELRQRVSEYRIEPNTLQHLPDAAMLLVEPRPDGPLTQAVECDPSIIMLPRSSPDPLPPTGNGTVTQRQDDTGWHTGLVP